MINENLEKIVRQEKQKNRSISYIRNTLKEYLQVYMLFYIYTTPKYSKNIIFTGGTCLRHFFGLERLSEDIDFDYIKDFSSNDLKEDIKLFFNKKYQYTNFSILLKQQEKQILLKFPILQKLNLAAKNESDLLYVKIDLSPIPSKNYSINTTTNSKYGFNYAAKHYDLPNLMAGKLHAIITRRHLKGQNNRLTIKGRDYYDLLWFLKKSIKPNLARLNDMLKQKFALKQIELKIDKKVKEFVKKYKSDFKSDLTPLIEEPDIINIYTESYLEEYLRNKNNSFT